MMSEPPEEPARQADESQPPPEATPVLVVRSDGAPPAPPASRPEAESAGEAPSPAEAGSEPMAAATETIDSVISANPVAAPKISEELRAAKWYTVSFLIVSGLFSVSGLIAMIWFTLRLISKATE
jgi:hypothetical protein